MSLICDRPFLTVHMMHTLVCAQQQSQTCVDLNTLINNRNPFALVNCTTLNEPTCDGITCSIPPGNIIETATLTLWPCTIPPIINIAVDSNATMLIGNFNFSESTNGSQIYLIHEGGVEVDLAVLDVDLKYSQMDTAVFSLQVKYNNIMVLLLRGGISLRACQC